MATIADLLRAKRGLAPSMDLQQQEGAEHDAAALTARNNAVLDSLALPDVGDPTMAGPATTDGQRRAVMPTQQERWDMDTVPAKVAPAPTYEPMPQPAAAQEFATVPAPRDEMGEAQNIDDFRALARNVELGTKQAIGGLTRTPVGELSQPMPSRATQLSAALKAKADAARQEAEDRHRRVLEAIQARQASTGEKRQETWAKDVEAKADASEAERARRAAKDAEKEKSDAEERKLRERTVKVGEAGLSLRERELAAERERKSTEKAQEEAGSKVGFRGATFAPKGGGKGDTTAINKAREKATAAGAIIPALERMQKALDGLAQDPTNTTLRAEVQAAQAVIAPSVNVVLGQGAMAQDEFRRMQDAIGNPTSASFFLDILDSATDANGAARAKARIDTTKRYVLQNVRSAFDAAQLVQVP